MEVDLIGTGLVYTPGRLGKVREYGYGTVALGLMVDNDRKNPIDVPSQYPSLVL